MIDYEKVDKLVENCKNLYPETLKIYILIKYKKDIEDCNINNQDIKIKRN